MRQIGDVKLLQRGVRHRDQGLKSLADDGKKQVARHRRHRRRHRRRQGRPRGRRHRDLVARFSAVDLVRRGAEALGGKGGGGRPDMAQAGGPDGAKAQAALDAVAAALGG